ncbi:MAG: DEAD/DEAH box helicase [Patescibacteria group bacterium]
MTPKNRTDFTFNDLGIKPKLLLILEQLKFTKPTAIQHQCIPLAVEGKDLVGIAQTGTGKTLAFAIPMIQKLAENKGQGLILLPTRELALQVNEVLQTLGKSIGLRTAVVIGGASSSQQLQLLRRHPHIVVSTPGRLIDHLENNNFSLNQVNFIVLDEADRMLDIGFMPAIKQILAAAPKERQTLMFSATMPSAIAEIASRFMKMPLRIEVAPSGTAAKNVEQELFIISKEAKAQLLDKILSDTPGTVLVFSRTKFGAKKITTNVRAMGHSAVELHSNKSLAQRKLAMEGFKSGKFRVMVATDIASRGIDVNDIALVINYDLPDNPEDYVHRIGRTGRAEKYGKAVSFATPDQRADVKQIERLINKSIPILSLPVLPPRRVNSVEVRSAHIGGRQYQSRRPSFGRNQGFRRR